LNLSKYKGMQIDPLMAKHIDAIYDSLDYIFDLSDINPGPWTVATRFDYFYIYNIVTGEIEKICKESYEIADLTAWEEAQRRNKVIFDNPRGLILLIGYHETLDKAIAKVLGF
jgi:hypothetical protein